MTQDLLERRLSEALADRAGHARPGPGRFDDVEQRAIRRRRRRSSVRAGTGAAAVVVVLAAVVGVVGLRGGGPADVTTTPATEAPVASVPAGLVGDRWAVPTAGERITADVAVETVVGVQSSGDDTQGIEVTPYLVVGTRTFDEATLYGLDGDRWTTTATGSEIAGGAARVTLVAGSGFDPTRFTQVPNSTDQFEGEMPPEHVGTATGMPYSNARPDVLLAAPESHAVTMPVEHLGLFDWVVLPETCTDGQDRCTKRAVGGDAERVIIVDAGTPSDFDLRALLASIDLRTAEALPLAPGRFYPASPDAHVEPYLPPPPAFAAPFLTVRLPIVHDDSVWPVDIPADPCTAYRQWKQIQIDHLGAFGTPGWIRWAEALSTIVPDVGAAEAFRTLADEEAAGHDASATQPGADALGVVIAYGDGHCP